jgi:hypothetical protein
MYKTVFIWPCHTRHFWSSLYFRLHVTGCHHTVLIQFLVFVLTLVPLFHSKRENVADDWLALPLHTREGEVQVSAREQLVSKRLLRFPTLGTT